MKHCFFFLLAFGCVFGNAGDVAAQASYPSQVNVLFNDSGVLFSGWNRATFSISGPGVYYSANHGDTWTADTVGLGTANVKCFAIAGSALFAVAGISGDGLEPGGVFRSTDTSTSWTRAIPDTSEALAASGDTLFAGGDNVIYRTTDAGAHWDSLPNSLGHISNLFAFHGSLFAKSYAGVVFRSTNGAESWSPAGIASTAGFRQSFAAIGSKIFALNSSGVWVSSDGGNSWGGGEMPGDTGAFTQLLAADNVLIAARTDGGFSFSRDEAADWSAPLGPAYYDPPELLSVMALVQDGSYIFFAIIDTDAVGYYRVPLSDLAVDEDATWTPAITVSPDPASSLLHIRGNASRVEILDLLGRPVLSGLAGTQSASINVQHLPAGRYEVVAHDGNKVFTAPILIER